MKINNLFSKLSWDVFSAGGTGVMLNLDRVTDFLRTQGSTAEVRGVTDSGWFLDNVPYAPADCQDPQRCAPTSAVQMGHSLWNGQMPLACKAQYVSQPWRCYFGHHLHRTLKSTSIISTQSMINVNHLLLFYLCCWQLRCSFSNGYLMRLKCWLIMSVLPCPKNNGTTSTRWVTTCDGLSPMFRKCCTCLFVFFHFWYNLLTYRFFGKFCQGCVFPLLYIAHCAYKTWLAIHSYRRHLIAASLTLLGTSTLLVRF